MNGEGRKTQDKSVLKNRDGYLAVEEVENLEVEDYRLGVNLYLGID